MKLQILIPQYQENDEIIRPLLDSIALQQNIDFNDIGLIIVNDGSDVLLSDKLINSYPFNIKYILNPHLGVSATRQTALDKATADYIMFCDADDMFYNMCGLWMVFHEIEQEKCDGIVSVFIEENHNLKTGEINYFNHHMDSTFVHGKVYRRQYLIDKEIKWNSKLTIHEDSYFNIQCQALSDNIKYCPNSFYLWKWRDESVCRHDPKYILKTYNNMLDSSDALIQELYRKGVKEKADMYVVLMIFDAYYTMNKPEWINQENQKFRNSTEERFAHYYKKYKHIWDEKSIDEKMIISQQIRQRSVMEGMHMEIITIDEWLSHIEQLN